MVAEGEPTVSTTACPPPTTEQSICKMQADHQPLDGCSGLGHWQRLSTVNRVQRTHLRDRIWAALAMQPLS